MNPHRENHHHCPGPAFSSSSQTETDQTVTASLPLISGNHHSTLSLWVWLSISFELSHTAFNHWLALLCTVCQTCLPLYIVIQLPVDTWVALPFGYLYGCYHKSRCTSISLNPCFSIVCGIYPEIRLLDRVKTVLKFALGSLCFLLYKLHHFSIPPIV